jgi:hypothetical protein
MAGAPDDALIDLTQLTCSKITLVQGAIDVEDPTWDVTVRGPGADRLTIDGNNQDAIFHAINIEIDGLTLTHGRVSGDHAAGGCISADFNVVLRSSRVVSCAAYGTASTQGGAIWAGYDASLVSSVVADNIASSSSGRTYGGGIFANYGGVGSTDSTISGNVAIGSPAIGGGVHSQGGSYLLRSTVDDNVADFGGGWYCEPGFLIPAFCRIFNSTISGNVAHNSGGGFVAKMGSTVWFGNSTVAFNTAETGHAGGVLLTQSPYAQIMLESTIFSNNTAPVEDISPDIDTDAGNFPTVEGGNDLIMVPGSIQPFPLVVGDPLLSPLAKNGGPTLTHALLPGSPAIDAGNNHHDFSTDQRGRARVSGAAPDIGAFEVQTDAIFANGFD